MSSHLSLFPFALLAMVLLLCAPHSVSAQSGTLTAWVSGPADVWQLAVTAPTGSLAAVTAALEQDIQAAIKATPAGSALNPTATVSAAVPQTSATPAVGLVATYTVANAPGLTDADIDAAVVGAPLNSLNAIAQPLLGGGRATVLAATGPATVTATVADDRIGISGGSFVWRLLFENAAGVALPTVQAPLAFDFQVAVDSAATSYIVSLGAPLVNVSGYYAPVNVYQMPNPVTTLSAATIRDRLRTAELPLYSSHVESVIASVPAIAAYSGLLPMPITTVTHLYPNPDGDPVTEIAVTERRTSDLRLLFSGTPAGWRAATDSETGRQALNATISAAILESVTRPGFNNSVEMLRASTVYDADRRIEGLAVVVRITQGITSLSRHIYTAAELASVVGTSTDFTTVVALYNPTASVKALRIATHVGASGSAAAPSLPPFASASVGALTAALAAAGPPAQFIAVGVDGNYALKCTNACVGMIILASAAVFLILVTFFAFCITVCCCYCGDALLEDEEGKADRAIGDPSTDACNNVNSGGANGANPLVFHTQSPEVLAGDPIEAAPSKTLGPCDVQPPVDKQLLSEGVGTNHGESKALSSTAPEASGELSAAARTGVVGSGGNSHTSGGDAGKLREETPRRSPPQQGKGDRVSGFSNVSENAVVPMNDRQAPQPPGDHDAPAPLSASTHNTPPSNGDAPPPYGDVCT